MLIVRCPRLRLSPHKIKLTHQAQGFKPEDVIPATSASSPSSLSNRTIGMVLGNAVSVPVTGAILQQATWSAGLVKDKVYYPY